MGPGLKGVYNLYSKSLHLFEPDKQRVSEGVNMSLDSQELDDTIGDAAQELREEVELVEGVYPKFDVNNYLSGDIAPVFFGSALNTFGVKELLETFLDIAPKPQGGLSEERDIKPDEDKFSGFVFKIHANMDPKHRDRIAFVKICSGIFKRNTNYKHVRLNKQFKFSNPTAFMAEKKSVVDEAFPGDIIGLYDTGNLKIGDSLTEGEDLHFKGIPSFSPEMFKYVENGDPLKAKQLAKGIDQLMDEGVAQLFTHQYTNRKIIGTVGQLQFEVIEYRLKHEYGATVRYEPFSLYKACWLSCEDEAELKEFKLRKQRFMAKDKHGRDVFLAESRYSIIQAEEKFPNVKFHYTSELVIG